MTDVLTTVNTRRTPQTQQADPRQVKNAAGGYTFQPDDWTLVHRFLTLGTDGGTYYTNDKDLTIANAKVLMRAAANDPVALVSRIVEVSVGGRAPRQNPALFALAIAASAENPDGTPNIDGRRAALDALPRVARTGTHLFLFARYVEQFRGWGPTLARAVGKWYTQHGADMIAREEAAYRRDSDVKKLATQVAKYRQREGWTHKDMLRLSHPKGVVDPAVRLVLNWAVGKGLNDYAEKVPELTPADLHAGKRQSARPRLSRTETVPDTVAIIADYEDAQTASTPEQWIEIISRGHGLTWEMLPDAALSNPGVWETLVDHGVPITALMRQLPRLTRLGVTQSRRTQIVNKLTDLETLRRGRVHPINVLVAQRTYASGRSARGDSTWTPDPHINDALDKAFYAAYGAVTPANKATLLAIDTSGSMGHAASGLPLTCREAAAALALVTLNVEPNVDVIGFSDGDTSMSRGYKRFTGTTVACPLDITPRRRLDDVLEYMSKLSYGGTDCSLPMLWALKNKRVYDTIVILTDNETYYGSVHPHQALQEYRNKTGVNTRLAVVSMTANGNTIADPRDPGQIDISGFDSVVPQLLSDFSRGDI